MADRLLPQASIDMQLIGRHDQEVFAVSSSRDGKFVASACLEGIKVWDASSKSMFMTLEGYRAVAFSLYDELLAFGGPNNTTVLVETRSWKPLAKYDGHEAPVSAVAFSPSGHLASASEDGTIHVWHIKKACLSMTLGAGGNQFVTALAISKNGILAFAQNKSIEIWDTKSAESFQLLGELQGPGGSNVSLAFSPDGNVLASRGSRQNIQIWDTNSAESLRLLGELQGHAGSDTALAFSPDGKVLASAFYGGNIQVRDTESWQVLVTHICTLDINFIGALVYLYGRTVVAGSYGSSGGIVACWSGHGEHEDDLAEAVDEEGNPTDEIQRRRNIFSTNFAGSGLPPDVIYDLPLAKNAKHMTGVEPGKIHHAIMSNITFAELCEVWFFCKDDEAFISMCTTGDLNILCEVVSAVQAQTDSATGIVNSSEEFQLLQQILNERARQNQGYTPYTSNRDILNFGSMMKLLDPAVATPDEDLGKTVRRRLREYAFPPHGDLDDRNDGDLEDVWVDYDHIRSEICEEMGLDENVFDEKVKIALWGIREQMALGRMIKTT